MRFLTTTGKVLIQLMIILAMCRRIRACIQLLNSQWKPKTLEERTKNAELVLTAKILNTYTPVSIQESWYPTTLYSATFEVISVLKGWDILKTLYYKKKSKSIISLSPKIVASAIGFGDSRLCWSSVEEGEEYALFLGYKRDTSELVAKYDDLFGAAELLYKRTERDILKSLGWEEWSSWSPCSKSCGSSGRQKRSRSCQKSSQQLCHGPKVQMKECNTYSCQNSTDVLAFIENYVVTGLQPVWRTGVFNNRIESERRTLFAPTYMLFDNEFPRDSVLHISFKGPVVDSQYLFSVYSINEEMEFGIMLSPFSVDFVYNKRIDAGTQILRKKAFSYTFTRHKWYNLGILLKDEEVQIRLDCEETVASALDEKLFSEFDIYGKMYLGADERVGEERNAKVKIGQITLVSDPESFDKQCGRINMDEEPQKKVYKEVQADEISGDGPDRPDDDTESGDVDDELGSGEEPVCPCKNGGRCQADGTCFCPHGWNGTHCDQPLCYNKCLNGGRCIKPNVCKCPKGTNGRYCQFTKCNPPCENGGRCIARNTCDCKRGYRGAQCQFKSCSKRCMNGGTCGNDGKCQCDSVYEGEYCQRPRKCKRYVRKLVPYSKPVVIYTNVVVSTPCTDNKTRKCLTKRRKYMIQNQVTQVTKVFCET